jgi:hypothetical protein
MDYKLIYLARRNPQIPPEDWPRAWRSHAVFASQFPVIGARISSLFYCSRIHEPALDGARVDPPGASRDYDGAAIVASPSPEGLGGELKPEDRARIFEDERRVFADLTPTFSFHCQETLVRGGPQGAAAVVRFLARKPGTSEGDFLDRWGGRHAEVAAAAADAAGAVTRYVQNRLREEPPPGYPFDGIEETWFRTAEDATRVLQNAAFASVTADLAEFCDMDRSVTLLTHVIHRWPRA